jgi:hypothetical protein
MIRFNSAESFNSIYKTYEYPIKLFSIENFLNNLDCLMNKQVELDLFTLIQIYEANNRLTRALNNLNFECKQQEQQHDGKVKKIFQIKTPINPSEPSESINILFIEDSSEYKKFIEKSHLKLNKNFLLMNQYFTQFYHLHYLT